MKEQKKKRKNKAFTLMEILVVVLILGILAAIAFPNYQRVLVKSRYDTLKTYSKTISLSADRFQMLTGHHTGKISELDITYSMESLDEHDDYSVAELGNGITCYLSNYPINNHREMRNAGCQRAVLPDLVMAYYQPFTSSFGGRECWAYSADLNSLANKICQEETEKEEPDMQDDGANIYFYD